MASLYLLIPLSILFLLIGVGVYFWAVRNGQYDDLDREGERILFDDEPVSADRDQSRTDVLPVDNDTESEKK